ncbi:MAG: hypothetical protein EHM73_15350 [Chroococcales cyanobacterium metabat2.561]|nr:MAG: hypothetical protein EHM73_15350 [Chroococcales cyanobacterium metabat2.561]
MNQFTSEKEITVRTVSDLYGQISDFNRLKELMPEQVVNWRVDGDVCSFTIKGMADLQIRYKEKVPETLVRIVPVKAPFHFEIVVTLDFLDNERGTLCQTAINADLNPMLFMLASRPLKHLVSAINSSLVLGR